MIARGTLVATVALAYMSAIGCSSRNVRHFKVSSHPEGALIFVNGEPRGQTNFDRLEVAFEKDEEVTIRVEKNGYQTDGRLIDEKSPERVLFFLAEAPRTEELVRAIDKLRRELSKVSETLQTRETHEYESIESVESIESD